MTKGLALMTLAKRYCAFLTTKRLNALIEDKNWTFQLARPYRAIGAARQCIQPMLLEMTRSVINQARKSPRAAGRSAGRNKRLGEPVIRPWLCDGMKELGNHLYSGR